MTSQLQEKSKLFEEVVAACRYILVNDSCASISRFYLDSRIPYQDQQKWEFGFWPEDDKLQCLTSLLDKKLLERLNLIYPKYVSGASLPHGHFHQHNLILPFRNYYGDIIALLGRTTLQENIRTNLNLQKYKYTIGSNKELYTFGLDKAKKSILNNKFVIATEGQFDCISCHSNNVTNTVALGSANLSRYQMFQLLRLTPNVLLMLDNDDAGLKAKIKIKKKYISLANIKTVSPPKNYKDIDEFFTNNKNDSYKNTVVNILKSSFREEFCG